MMRRWIAKLRELDQLADEADRARVLHEYTRLGQGSDAFRLRYEAAADKFNARKFWWMRAKRPNDGGEAHAPQR